MAPHGLMGLNCHPGATLNLGHSGLHQLPACWFLTLASSILDPNSFDTSQGLGARNLHPPLQQAERLLGAQPTFGNIAPGKPLPAPTEAFWVDCPFGGGKLLSSCQTHYTQGGATCLGPVPEQFSLQSPESLRFAEASATILQ